MSGLVLPPGGGRQLTGPAQHVTFKITGARSTVGSLFEVVVPVGFDVGAHRHTRSEEFFYVLDGEVDLFAFEPVVRTAGDWSDWRSADGETVRRGTRGALIHIPPGCPHGFANAGHTPARLLFQAAPPPDHERYFEELLALLADGPPVAPEAVEELRRRYDIEQLTPLKPGVPLPETPLPETPLPETPVASRVTPAYRAGMLLRSAVESDLDRFLPLLVADPGCSTVTAESYRTKLASGEYRLDRTWLAEQDGDLRAVAVWWGGAGSAAPQALDGIFTHPAVGTGPERTALAAELLRAAHTAFGDSPSYHVFLPGDWREQPAVLAALTWRQQAARQAGLTGELERLRFEWRPEVCPEPAPPGTGLEFAEEPDDEVFVELFRRVIAGSLDSDSTTGAAKVGAEQQAREDVAFYRDEMLGERSWWRVARNAAGELVGFGLPSRNHSFPVVGYLGVLPEHRGHGHAESILAEITRILIAETAPAEIRADTDLGNHPMAAAFLRTGYRNSARRLVLSAD